MKISRMAVFRLQITTVEVRYLQVTTVWGATGEIRIQAMYGKSVISPNAHVRRSVGNCITLSKKDRWFSKNPKGPCDFYAGNLKTNEGEQRGGGGGRICSKGELTYSRQYTRISRCQKGF